MATNDGQAHGSDRSQSIDWYSEGESRSVEVAGIRIEVRHVARKGRKARIAIVAPAGALFCEFGEKIDQQTVQRRLE